MCFPTLNITSNLNPPRSSCQRKLSIFQLCLPRCFWCTENSKRYLSSLPHDSPWSNHFDHHYLPFSLLAGVFTRAHAPFMLLGWAPCQPGSLNLSTAWFHHCCHSNSCRIRHPCEWCRSNHGRVTWLLFGLLCCTFTSLKYVAGITQYHFTIV